MSSIINNIFPCPFCGNQKLKVEYKTKRLYYPTTSIQATCSVRCNCCHARGGTVTKVYQITQWKGDTYLEQQAIRKWNKRFTGLTDSNGVKIFEGDIVHLYGDKDTDTKCVNYKALVVFVHGGFCAIDGTLENYTVCRFDFTSSLNCEVIGNIYDNPELIKEDN